MLALADLKDYDEKAVKGHISGQYGGKESGFSYGSPTQEDEQKLAGELADCEILVAYESVGSWGCDSSSFFLFRKGGKLYENHGSHCSCYGFEGQWEPEETTRASLLARGSWSLGGYDVDGSANDAAIRAFIETLPAD